MSHLITYCIFLVFIHHCINFLFMGRKLSPLDMSKKLVEIVLLVFRIVNKLPLTYQKSYIDESKLHFFLRNTIFQLSLNPTGIEPNTVPKFCIQRCQSVGTCHYTRLNTKDRNEKRKSMNLHKLLQTFNSLKEHFK